jgi:putative phosphoesterase
MKRLVIVSDTHGNKKGVEKLSPIIKENHYFVHLGDGVLDLDPVLEACPKKTYFCRGNCDLFASVPDEGILEVEDIKIFYCHGHRYGVKTDLNALARAAKSRGCQVALFGHTHRPIITEEEGVTLINPGSLKLPTDAGGTYCYMVVNGNKVVSTIVGEGLVF